MTDEAVNSRFNPGSGGNASERSHAGLEMVVLLPKSNHRCIMEQENVAALSLARHERI